MQTVKLNLIPGSVLPVVNVSQYDEKRQFALQVYEGATAYSLSGKSVQIRGTKPDGNGFAYDATDGVVSVSGNTVTISTTQQMTAVGGQTMAELRITSGDTILGTLNFVLMVEPSALSDDTPISDTDIPAIERDFRAALEEVQEAAETATTKAGEASTSATNAGNSATSAAADALKAEGYAVGKQNGSPVGSESPYYHNNAEYHDTHAGEQAYNASQSATAAGNSATAAAADSLEAEGWAVGEQNGTPVGPTSPYYQNNAAYYAAQAGQYATGGLIFKGSVAFANIPTTGMVNGDMYNITDDFTTDSRFIEGAGVAVKAGADIAYVAGSVNKWDILALGGGGADALDDLTDVSLTSPAEGDLLQYDATEQKWANSAKIPQKVAGLQKTGCVNVLPNSIASQVIVGMTFTENSDNSVNISNGTPTGRVTVNSDEIFTLHKAGIYTFSTGHNPADITGSTPIINFRFRRVSQSSSETVSFDMGETNKIVFTVNEDFYSRDFFFGLNELQTYSNNVVLYPMLYPGVLTDDTPYQPYSMTNRELTEAVNGIFVDNRVEFYATGDGSHYYAESVTEISKPGYKPVGVVGFYCGSIGYNVYTVGVRYTGGAYKLYIGLQDINKNNIPSGTRIQVRADILYIKTAQRTEG